MVRFSFLLAVVVAAASPTSPHKLAQADVLALVKRDSAQFCSSEENASCEFSASKSHEGWLARATLFVKQPDGHRAYPIGGHYWYIYSSQGELLRSEPGL